MADIYVHLKTGGIYTVLDWHVMVESTWRRGVLYQSWKTGEKIVRDHEEFMDGRFVPIQSIVHAHLFGEES